MKINEIKINAGRRKVDSQKVKELAESIKELGLLNPVTINEDKTLIAGMHRLEACKLLGHEEIKVNKINLSFLLAELAEIDENLVRNDLHWLEQDNQLKKRKEIYEKLHPETKNGGDRKSDKSERENRVLKTFSEDTAEKLGQSQRTIQESIQRADKFSEEIEEQIVELGITKTEGTDLARFEPEQQFKIIKEKKQNTDLDFKSIIKKAKEIKKQKAEEFKAKIEQRIETKVKENPVSFEEQEMLNKISNGETIVINMNTHFHVLKYAKDKGIYKQIDRYSEFGNPFFLDSDGDREQVCNGYIEYFKHKRSLHNKVKELKGKVLGCHCAPLQCHGDHLKRLADEN